ncbi:TPA: hypothetical protein ACH3X3_004895 [Trebouxia sp. C0006]
MKIKKSSGDKEHSLRLLPCFGRRSRHPHQDEQPVNGLVHSFRKMLQQFIWYAVGTRSSSGTGVFNLGSRGSGGGSGPGFRNFMQVSGILAGAWSASPDVSRTSVWAAMPVHMDSDTRLL